MRGEPNTIGVPTKWRPSRDQHAYFADHDWGLATVREPIIEAFRRMEEVLAAGHDLVIPADGIGSGLAMLPDLAPTIFKRIEAWIAVLEARSSAVPPAAGPFQKIGPPEP